MLHQLARKVLEDLTAAGAVLGPGGAVLEVNEAFRECFYYSRPGGAWALGSEVQSALQRAGTMARHPAGQSLFLRREGRGYRLDVYFLDKPAGKGALRLVIATPVGRAAEPAAAFPEEPPRQPIQLSPQFAELIGRDPGFVQALLLAQRAAQTDLPVLILGESGTGKEILARTIHRASRRHGRTFVDVNCAALPDSQVESELFGCAKGAVHSKGKAGYFEIADQGTIFMDEVGFAAPHTQAQLLRVLESGRFKRIGGNRNISVDVRLIAASNLELGQRVAEGRFQADLLYRINTITIRLLPLRERINDLAPLAEHFLQCACGPDKRQMRFSKEALEMLRSHAWPGNVRELRGVIEHAVNLTAGKLLTPRSLHRGLRPVSKPADPRAAQDASSGPADVPGTAPAEPCSDLLATVLERAEEQHIRKVLRASRNRSEAIRRLGISRRTFYAKLRQYGLE